MFIVTWMNGMGYQVACFFEECKAKAKLDEVKALTDTWGCDLTNTGTNRTEVCKGI